MKLASGSRSRRRMPGRTSCGLVISARASLPFANNGLRMMFAGVLARSQYEWAGSLLPVAPEPESHHAQARGGKATDSDEICQTVKWVCKCNRYLAIAAACWLLGLVLAA